MSRLTVIIPTYRRSVSLMRALASLEEQDIPIELIVVDNAADIVLRTALNSFNEDARHPVRWIPEPRLGLHYARNTGATHATCELLAYVDDDATFAPGWARTYVEGFAAHPEMVAAGGPSHPAWECPPPAWLLALVARRPMFFQLSLRDMGPDASFDETESFWGLNMAIRRSALLAAGGFNPELVGDESVGDGEGGLFRKLRATGARVGYLPGALVHHHIPAHRMTVRYLRWRMKNEGRSEAFALVRRDRASSRAALARMFVKNIMLAGLVELSVTPVRWSRRVFPLRLRMLAAERTGRAMYAWRALADDELRRQLLEDDWMVR
ncbi:MAG: glycosyltransferase family A protein [Gemmatimonadaceae bacterium]